MKYIFKHVGVVILAGGKGSRLGCNGTPKALCEVAGKPLIFYTLDTLKRGGVPSENISIVLGYQGEKIKEALGDKYNYAWQKQLLGTAHAAATGEQSLPSHVKDFLVLNGDDSAFYKYKTLRLFVAQHLQNKNNISLLTCEVKNPTGMGRVVRDYHDRVLKIVEKEKVGEKEKNITEISTGTFCFNRKWFRRKYRELEVEPKLQEYQLPSLAGKGFESGKKFRAVKLADPEEWVGINTPQELKKADEKMKKRQQKRKQKQ